MSIHQAYYTIIKFIPDLIKEEPINIGLILHSPQENYIRTDFGDKKIKLISRYNRDIDLEVVQYIIKDIRENFNNENFILRNHKMGDFNDDKLLYNMFASYANQLQFTKPKAIITQNLDEEFNSLFKGLIFKGKTIKRHKPIEERTMKSSIRDKFDKLGLIDKKIVQENHIEIDRFGDSINLDFKYINGKPNLIKNISLDIKSKNPMEHSKLWLANYEEIKRASHKKRLEQNIQVIYYLPKNLDTKINSSIEACLEAASDELIDYSDTEKVDFFIRNVANIAHC